MAVFDYYIWIYCPTGNFTAAATFNSTLSLLPSLSASTACHDGFSNQTAGNPPNQVYALGLCRGDISSDRCLSCLTTATQIMEQSFPLASSAAVWYDKCMLRYSNQSFFSTYDSSSLVAYFNTANASNTARFSRILGDLLDELTKKATYGSDGRKFSVGERNFTDFVRLFGMAQYSRDLSSEDCCSCLLDSIRFIPGCCDGKQGASLEALGCYVRYELYPFYNMSAAAVSPSSPPPTPAASPSSDTRGGEEFDELVTGGRHSAYSIEPRPSQYEVMLTVGVNDDELSFDEDEAHLYNDDSTHIDMPLSLIIGCDDLRGLYPFFKDTYFFDDVHQSDC